MKTIVVRDLIAVGMNVVVVAVPHLDVRGPLTLFHDLVERRERRGETVTAMIRPHALSGLSEHERAARQDARAQWRCSMKIDAAPLKENEFRISEVPPGSVVLVGDVAVFNVDGGFCAIQAKCTHKQGPLNEGPLDGSP